MARRRRCLVLVGDQAGQQLADLVADGELELADADAVSQFLEFLRATSARIEYTTEERT